VLQHSKIPSLSKKYVDQGLTTRQIAKIVGVSKTTVLNHLHKAGLSDELQVRAKRKQLPPNPRYGVRYVDGKVESNPKELRIIRMIVELRERQKNTFIAIAGELNRKGYVTRAKTVWRVNTVKELYYRWRGKN
jgi:predicted transcriptional regulator